MPKQKITALQIVVLVLSVYVLVAMTADILLDLRPEISELLFFIDNIVCGVFILEFLTLLYKAPDKLDYIKKGGWLDLISSIPTVGYFRFARVAKIIRLTRILKAFNTIRSLASHLYTNKIEATFTSLGVVTIMTMIISSITILYTEDVPHGNIKNAEDALWWTVTTVTTVGYGDLYPVTRMGRIISVLLMLSGITMFSSITALIASYFVKEMK